MKRIDQWLSALELAFVHTGQIAPWPMPISEVAPYFSDLEAADLYQKMQVITRPGSKIKLSDLFVSCGATKGSLMDLIVGLKVAKPAISATQRVWFVEKIFDALEEVQSGDIFCLDGTNRIWQQDQAQKVCQATHWTHDPALIRSCFKVSASIKALIWSLYFYGWDDVGYQHHGPYPVTLADGTKALLVVSDFFNIRPVELWPETKEFDYPNAKLLVLYKPMSAINIDIFDHPSVRGALTEAASAVYLEVGGKEIISTKMAGGVCGKILHQVARQHELLNSMTHRQVTWKFVESRYYAFRKWRAAFGQDWRPPKLILDIINTWKEIRLDAADELGWNELKQAFDPRSNYVPGQQNNQKEESNV